MMMTVSRYTAIFRGWTTEEATPVDTPRPSLASSRIIGLAGDIGLWCHCLLLLREVGSQSREVMVPAIAPDQKHDRRIRHVHQSSHQLSSVVFSNVPTVHSFAQLYG